VYCIIILLAIPFARDYSGYRGWPFPAKNTRRRIVLAHGVVPGGKDSPQKANDEGQTKGGKRVTANCF